MIHNKKYNQDNERKPFVPCIRKAICRQMKQLASKVRAKLDPLNCAEKRESIAKLVSSSNYSFLGIPVDQGKSLHISWLCLRIEPLKLNKNADSCKRRDNYKSQK